MVDHIRLTDEQRAEITVLLNAGELTRDAIALQVGCGNGTVSRIKAEMVKSKVKQTDLTDPQTLKDFKGTLAHAVLETLQAMKPKKDKSTDLWNRMRTVQTGVMTHRLLSDQSTANIAHRSLSSLVSQRKQDAPEVVESKVVPEKNSSQTATEAAAKPKARKEATVMNSTQKPVAFPLKHDALVPEPVVIVSDAAPEPLV